VATLAGQQRPDASRAPPLIRTSIVALPVAIVVIAVPARTEGRFHFEHRVDNTERIHNDRVVGASNAVANQFEKTGVDDFLRRIDAACAGCAVGKGDLALIGIFVRLGIIHLLGMNPYVVARDAAEERALRGYGPAFDVAFEEVGILFEILRGGLVAFFAGEG